MDEYTFLFAALTQFAVNNRIKSLNSLMNNCISFCQQFRPTTIIQSMTCLEHIDQEFLSQRKTLNFQPNRPCSLRASEILWSSGRTELVKFLGISSVFSTAIVSCRITTLLMANETISFPSNEGF